MKKNLLRALISGLFRPAANTTTLTGNLFKVPAGYVADAVGANGLFGLMANLDAIDWELSAIVSSATAITLTGAQFFQQVIDISGAPGGGVTLTTPTAAQIIAAIQAAGCVPPGDGYNYPLMIMNDSLGQTITLAAGTGVTITGNLTIATATTRHFLVSVNVNAGTVTMVNYGTMNL